MRPAAASISRSSFAVSMPGSGNSTTTTSSSSSSSRARATRRAAAAAGGATTGPKVRRGSWHPKQRATHFEDALEKYKRWRYDPLKSLASQHFKDDANLNERSYAGAQFYDQFHMPRAVFEEVLRELSAHPPFADKSAASRFRRRGSYSSVVQCY